MRALGERAQAADEQQEQPHRGLALLGGEPLGGLEHRGAGGVAAVVGDDVAAERRDDLGLGDDVELAPGVEQAVDVAERLEPARRTCSVRRTPLATARTRPVRRVSSVMIRSASPSFCTRSTTPSSR